MADFCKQCSIGLFGEDHKDLAGLGGGEPLQEGMGWAAICEGCGYIVVDTEGACCSEGCRKHGNPIGT